MAFYPSRRALMASISMLALSWPVAAQQATPNAPAVNPAIGTNGATLSGNSAQNPAETADNSIMLDAVSITADRNKTLVIDAPASISVINDAEIARRQPENLGDLLRGLPGVEVYGGARSTVQEPIIRGLTGDRVVVRVDGARANLNVGHKGRLFIDPEMLKSAEVYRGPASTLQGSGALGGVLALTTKDANDFLENGEKIGARVKMGYGSVDHALTTNGMVYGRPTENSDILAGITRKNTGDFEAGGGEKQPYTDDDFVNALIKGGIDINDASRLTVSLQRYTDDHQLPSAPDSGAPVNATSNFLVDRESEQTSLILGYTYHDIGNDLVDARLNAYGMRTDLDEKRVSDGRRDERSLDTIGLEGSNTARFDLAGHDLAVTLGGEVFQDSQEGRRNGAAVPGLFPDAEMRIYGVYMDHTLAVTDALDVTAGVRFDSYNLSADDQRDRDDNAISPRFSASYRVTSWLQPYVSYAQAFKAPSLTEMYNDGQHFPGNFFVPNPDLKAETAKTWEFGTNFKADDVLSSGDALRAKLAYFNNKVEDYIEQQIGATTTSSVNLPEAEIKGFEAELNYDTGVMFAGLAYSHLRGENSRTGEYLSNIPADKIALSGGYRLVDTGLELGGRANLVRNQDREPDDGTGNPVERDGYALFDLFANWDASQTVPGLTVNFGIDNILDQKYRVSSTQLYEPGRNFKISASMKF